MSSFMYAAYNENTEQLTDPEENLLSTLQFDPSGNLIASVNHRTGLLASLLGLAGGAGEIAVATDAKALVRYTGVIGEATVFYKNPVSVNSLLSLSNSAVTTGATGATLLLDNIINYGSASVLDAIGQEAFTLPVSTGLQNTVVLNGFATFGASVAGTYRTISVEYLFTGTTWLPVAEFTGPLTANGNLPFLIPLMGGALVGSNTKFRLRVKQDSGANMQIYAQCHVQVLAA